LIEDFVELMNTFVSQTMENSTDAVHITHTLSNIYNRQNSRSRPRYLGLEDAEEQQPALEGGRQRSREGTVAHSPPAGQ
jgi:hypothetical protein